MKPSFLRVWVALIVSGGLFAAILLLDGSTSRGQQPPKAVAANQAYSAIHCIGCHGGKHTDAYRAYEKDKDKPTEFVLLTEYQTWRNEDLHSKAFANIVPDPKGGAEGKGNLAFQMQGVLANSPGRKDANYSIDRAAECLTCHSVDRKPGPIANAAADRFHTANGVSCEACHGFAEKWFAPHVHATWRDVPPDEKTKWGLVDLRDPYTRAVKCASCHVGNKDEGKFVTHEMYAAGHPPLPPFELVTYCRDAPRHYLTHREMHAAKDKSVIASMTAERQKRLHYHNPDEQSPEARNLAIGTVAAFEATMALLARDAEETAKSGDLLDVAHFDCYACHHDLRADGSRQPRPGLRPGRPMMRPWATETLQVVLKHGESAPGPNVGALAEKTTALNDRLLKLNAAFDAKPFGDAVKVSAEAKALATLCTEARPELARIEYSPAETRRLYDLMAARVRDIAAKSGALDHDTAQQLAWALEVLQNELREANAGGGDPKVVAAAKAKLSKIVAMSLRGEAGEPIAPRVQARQQEIGRFQSKDFFGRADEFLKAFEAK